MELNQTGTVFGALPDGIALSSEGAQQWNNILRYGDKGSAGYNDDNRCLDFLKMTCNQRSRQ